MSIRTYSNGRLVHGHGSTPWTGFKYHIESGTARYTGTSHTERDPETSRDELRMQSPRKRSYLPLTALLPRGNERRPGTTQADDNVWLAATTDARRHSTKLPDTTTQTDRRTDERPYRLQCPSTHTTKQQTVLFITAPFTFSTFNHPVLFTSYVQTLSTTHLRSTQISSEWVEFNVPHSTHISGTSLSSHWITNGLISRTDSTKDKHKKRK